MIAILPRSLGAQAAVIGDAVSCATCRIVEHSVVTLQTRGKGHELSQTPSSVRVDDKGRFWVSPLDGPPYLYASDGAFMRRVGGAGRGPGEFIGPVAIAALPGDSMLLVDRRGSRVSVYSKNLLHARTFATPISFWSFTITSWPDGIIANAGYRTPQSGRLPLHRIGFSAQGFEVHASFGPDSAFTDPYAAMNNLMTVTSDGAGRVWAADRYRYRLSAWTSSGRFLQTIERRASWFPGVRGLQLRDVIPSGNSTTPPTPVVQSIHSDGEGLLWVVLNVPSRSWKKAWELVPRKAAEAPGSVVQTELLYDTIIEVIDPARQMLMARTSMKGRVYWSIPPTQVVRVSSDGDGFPRIEVVTLKIIDSGRRGLTPAPGNGGATRAR